MTAQTKGNVTNEIVETLLMELEDPKYWNDKPSFKGRGRLNRAGVDLVKSIRFFIGSQNIDFNIFNYVRNLRKAKSSPELLDSECYKDGTPITGKCKFFLSFINNCPDAYSYTEED